MCVCYMLDVVPSTSHISFSGNCHNNHMKLCTTIIPHSEMRKLMDKWQMLSRVWH